MSETRYIFEAVESIRLAKNSEQQLEYANAAKLYDTAIHLFITGVQADKNKHRQDLVRKKLQKCLERAERCRKSSIHSAQAKNQNLELSPRRSISRNIVWPSDLHAYHLTKVITADIWLVSCLEDKEDSDQVEGIMLGIPRIRPARNTQDLISTLEKSKSVLSQQDYDLANALSHSIAKKHERRNSRKKNTSTAERFLKKYQTAVENEIRTSDTIFLVMEATQEKIEFAKEVKNIMSQKNHSSCKTEGSCQACRLRASQSKMSFEKANLIEQTENLEIRTDKQIDDTSTLTTDYSESSKSLELVRKVSSPATSGIESSPLSSRSASLEKPNDIEVIADLKIVA